MTETMFDVDQIQVRAATVESVDEERGLVEVRIAPYEYEAQLDEGLAEIFSQGAFSASVGNPSRCKVSDQQHGRSVVIGNAVELRDESDALYGKLRIVDTVAGRDVLTLLRPGRDGSPAVLDEMSVEFRPQRKFMRVQRRAKDVLVRHDKAVLVGVSPVAAGAYGREARVLSVRDAERDRVQERELAYLQSLTAGRG